MATLTHTLAKIKRLPERQGETGGYNWDHGSLVFEGLKNYRVIDNKKRKKTSK